MLLLAILFSKLILQTAKNDFLKDLFLNLKRQIEISLAKLCHDQLLVQLGPVGDVEADGEEEDDRLDGDRLQLILQEF